VSPNPTTRTTLPRFLPLLLALIAALALAAPASAAPITMKKSMWGPVERDGVSQFPIYADLGVGLFQVTVFWNDVAPNRPAEPADPADPAYRWPPAVDQAIAEGAKYGIEVSVMLIGAPPWANGGEEWRFAPKHPRDFADFAGAAARRWPGVRHWMIWSEPSKEQNFQPLAPDNGEPLRTAKQKRGPRLYARILDASYAALKSVSPKNLVIGGNTFTVGTVRPRHYIRALRLPNGKPPRMDLFGHNPFSMREPNLRDRNLGSGYADFNDLDTLAPFVDRHLHRKGARKLRFFLSEYSLPTDHSNHEFNFWLGQDVQARWLTKALQIVRSYKRIYTFGYLGLYDDDRRPDGLQVERGLIQRNGERKPGYAAFRDG
jgi:hypothetical protein